MSLQDLSFKLYTNAALTNLAVNPLQITHQSDFSDNPRDYVYYFGSPLADRVLYANSNPEVDQITLTPTSLLPAWQASTPYTLGQSRRPTVGNNRRYVVSTAGESGATEPTWPTAIGSTVADGGVIWTCIAQTHEPTEIKLALTLAGLDTATTGAPLSLGTEIEGGSANAVEIHVRITNAVSTVSNNSAQPELGLNVDVIETAGA